MRKQRDNIKGVSIRKVFLICYVYREPLMNEDQSSKIWADLISLMKMKGTELKL